MIETLHTHSVVSITTVELVCVDSGKQLDLFMEERGVAVPADGPRSSNTSTRGADGTQTPEPRSSTLNICPHAASASA
jgi:hypothetical protein